MATRHFTIPAAATFRGMKIPFHVSFKHILDTDERFNRSGAGIRAAVRLEKAFEGHVEGEVVQLGDEDWRAGALAFESPTHGWCPEAAADGKPIQIPGKTFLTFIDAWSDSATRDAPKPPAPEPAEPEDAAAKAG